MKAKALRARTPAAAIALAVALAFQPGCGVAQRAAKGAAEAAIGTLSRKVGDREHLEELKEGIQRRATSVLVDELSQPEQLQGLQRIAESMATGTIRGTSRAMSGPLTAGAGLGERGRSGATPATPVEAVAEQAARAFSRQLLAEIGPSGQGPLSTSLAAMTERLTESMARGARGDLAPLFPECSGVDASQCLDRAVERMSRASSAGIAAGVRESLGAWPLVLAFGGGVLSTVVLAWGWGVYRARRPTAAS
jgi:hypothetical protein